jgi:hypothetical protein
MSYTKGRAGVFHTYQFSFFAIFPAVIILLQIAVSGNIFSAWDDYII